MPIDSVQSQRKLNRLLKGIFTRPIALWVTELSERPLAFDIIRHLNPKLYGGRWNHPPGGFLHCAETFGTTDLKRFDL